jgi:hypothetical protein
MYKGTVWKWMTWNKYVLDLCRMWNLRDTEILNGLPSNISWYMFWKFSFISVLGQPPPHTYQQLPEQETVSNNTAKTERFWT